MNKRRFRSATKPVFVFDQVCPVGQTSLGTTLFLSWPHRRINKSTVEQNGLKGPLTGCVNFELDAVCQHGRQIPGTEAASALGATEIAIKKKRAAATRRE